jgi:hypothetical protein
MNTRMNDSPITLMYLHSDGVVFDMISIERLQLPHD